MSRSHHCFGVYPGTLPGTGTSCFLLLYLHLYLHFFLSLNYWKLFLPWGHSHLLFFLLGILVFLCLGSTSWLFFTTKTQVKQFESAQMMPHAQLTLSSSLMLSLLPPAPPFTQFSPASMFTHQHCDLLRALAGAARCPVLLLLLPEGRAQQRT